MRDILDDEYQQFVIRIRPTHAEALFLDFVDALDPVLHEKQEVRMQQGEDELRPKFVDYVEFNYDRLPAQGKELAHLLADRCNEQGKLGLPDDGRSLGRALRECGLLLNGRMRRNLGDYFSYAKQFKRASNAGRKMPPANHNAIVFGNPGTGKTRFARILAKILIECGVAETVASVDAIDLFGTRVGQTRRNVLKKAEELHRGVLIIENAFALASEQTRSLGDEAVSALVEVMDSWPGELTIILVAASSAADYILEANPDLASRLGWSFALPPCDADLHAAIALDELDESELIIEDMGLVASELVKLFSYFDGMPQLGGGRFARRVAQEIIFTHTLRTGELAGNLEPEDIPSRERVCEMMRVRHVSGTEEGKLKTARHEAGHVVCDLAQFGLGCVQEVTIDPRGAGANGFTRLIYSDAMPSLSFYRKRLVGMYGGMAAELQFYNESFGGVEGDLEQATLYAREMATRLGMEETLTSYPRACPLHELPEAVQEEIEARLRWALDEARVIVSRNAELVDAIAKALMTNTALRQREIEDIVGKHGGIH